MSLKERFKKFLIWNGNTIFIALMICFGIVAIVGIAMKERPRGEIRCYKSELLQDNSQAILYEGRFIDIFFNSDGNRIKVTDETGKRTTLTNAQCVVTYDE